MLHVGEGLYSLYTCIYVEMDKDGVLLITAVLPLAIKYTVVARWRSPADGFESLRGLTVQVLCLSGYSHFYSGENYVYKLSRYLNKPARSSETSTVVFTNFHGT